MENLLVKLYQSPKTIFTMEDIAILWGESDPGRLRAKIQYYVKRKSLLRLRRGVFAKNKEFSPKELATKIYTPAYVSFETVLREAGIIFQHYESVYVASYTTKTIHCGRLNVVIRKIKDALLYNAAGIITNQSYSQASPERALLDMMYLFPNYYYDNLDPIDWNQCQELVAIYTNRQLRKRLTEYQRRYAQ